MEESRWRSLHHSVIWIEIWVTKYNIKRIAKSVIVGIMEQKPRKEKEKKKKNRKRVI